VQQKQWGEAARLYREHLSRNPGDQLALRSLSALECYRLAQYEECARTADRLLSFMPIDSQGVSAVAYARTMLAERAGRGRDSTRVRAEMKKVGEAYLRAGYWLYMNENYTRAERYFRSAVHAQSQSLEGHLRLGILFWNRHNSDSALAWFRKAERIAPQSEDALINQIVVFREKNQLDSAWRVYDRLSIVRKQLYPDSSFASPNDTTLPPFSLDFRGETRDERTHLITF
jgi:tetratricopeptide (TPR) repeat protein